MKVFVGNNLVRVCGILLRRFEFKGKWRIVMVLGKIFCWLGIDWLEAIPCPGVQLRVPVKDRAGLLMWAGIYEPKLTRLFTKLVRPGWVVLDGGHTLVGLLCFSVSLSGRQDGYTLLNQIHKISLSLRRISQNFQMLLHN